MTSHPHRYLFAGLFLLSGWLHAQTASAPASRADKPATEAENRQKIPVEAVTNEEAPVKLEAVEVTGTRIRTLGDEVAAIPVFSLPQIELERRGVTRLADIRLAIPQLGGAVGFMTSRRALAWMESEATEGDCNAWAIGTVGLSNRLRAGDSCSVHQPGTINLLVCCSQPLTVEASLEALCLASEAKTLAMMETGERSVQSGLPATGTGTDCLAIAWPLAGERSCYAGKHTPAGSAIGRAAYLAVAKGIREWKEEQV